MRDFTSASFYAYLDEHKLMGTRCQSCGTLHLPPRPICTACHGEDLEWAEMSGQGQLIAFTTVHIAPTAMLAEGYGRNNPYCTGIVQLQEGPAISAQILDVDTQQPQNIKIGTPLSVAFIERGNEEAKQTFLAFKRV
jgi:uncharacterized OB-fold protein